MQTLRPTPMPSPTFFLAAENWLIPPPGLIGASQARAGKIVPFLLFSLGFLPLPTFFCLRLSRSPNLHLLSTNTLLLPLLSPTYIYGTRTYAPRTFTEVDGERWLHLNVCILPPQ